MAAPPAKAGPLMYAELMLNIKQVSVVATLPTPTDSTTQAQVTDGGRSIQIHHQGSVVKLDLPGAVNVSAALPVPTAATRLSWRLPLSPDEDAGRPFSLDTQSIPWNSGDIKTGSHISCRTCRQVIIQNATIQSWKDLPSENWAEMMEFWHCHKPHDHEPNDDESLTRRGYGASTSIVCSPGTGFVDLTSLVFSESDCQNLLFSLSTSDAGVDSSALALNSSSSSAKVLNVFCRDCKAEIGMFRTSTTAVNLFKWQISCETVLRTQLPTGAECLSASLIASISRSGTAKSIITPHISPVHGGGEESHSQVLHLWVLNSNVKYSSSLVNGKKAAIKVLYKEVDAGDGNRLVESMKSDVQEINFPSVAITHVREKLQSSNLMLPAHERSLKDWHVGLLERWDSCQPTL